ncbi:MAG: rod shape-determining protein MreC [Planctomycetota bacterium]
MKSRLRAGLVVIGLALVSLTPAAPTLIRWPELLAVQLYRPLDALVVWLRRDREGDERVVISGEELLRIRQGIRDRNALLTTGAEKLLPGRPRIVARVVEMDLRGRRLLIDLGAGVEVPSGSPVLAGAYGIGRVTRQENGIAVVTTPWTPNARFAGACAVEDERRMVRFVTSGLSRTEWSAAVENPERKSALVPGASVFVPDVKDLELGSIPLLPADLRLGRLVEDQTLAKTGHKAFCVVPEIDLMLLDAVVVLSDGPIGARPSLGFETTKVGALWCGLASPWRHGLTILGFGLPEQGSVELDGRYAGAIRSRLIDVARVRGVFDPGQRFPVLVVGQEGTGVLLLDSVKTWSDGTRFRVLSGTQNVAVGDLVLTSGRGRHVPRGHLIGQVVRAEDDLVEVRRHSMHQDSMLEVLRRSGFPSSPWGPSGGGP